MRDISKNLSKTRTVARPDFRNMPAGEHRDGTNGVFVQYITFIGNNAEM